MKYVVAVLKYNPVLETLSIEEKYIEILKHYRERFLFNETVGRFYHIEIYSSDPVYQCDQDIALLRTWNNFYS